MNRKGLPEDNSAAAGSASKESELQSPTHSNLLDNAVNRFDVELNTISKFIYCDAPSSYHVSNLDYGKPTRAEELFFRIQRHKRAHLTHVGLPLDPEHLTLTERKVLCQGGLDKREKSGRQKLTTRVCLFTDCNDRTHKGYVAMWNHIQLAHFPVRTIRCNQCGDQIRSIKFIEHEKMHADEKHLALTQHSLWAYSQTINVKYRVMGTIFFT